MASQTKSIEKPIICGIQQIGVGIANVEQAWKWYRDYFNLNVPIFQEAADAPFMTDYTGNKVQSRSATLALNLAGGSGFEIWQYTSREGQAPDFGIKAGDLGIYLCRVKTKNLLKAFDFFKQKGVTLSEKIENGPAGEKHFFIKDPFDNIFQIVQGIDWLKNENTVTGGAEGAAIGISDVEKSLSLYRDVLGYDKIIYDEKGSFPDLKALPGGSNKFRRVLLTHSKPRKGPFSRLLGSSRLELIQVLDRKPNKIFKDRYWGDLGYIHLCFDIEGMDELENLCNKKGFPFTVNSKDSFDMGEASGHFTYIEDPDGTLIEFVETHKIPIFKKLGIYLNLSKRKTGKPLPDWMLKLLALNRNKD